MFNLMAVIASSHLVTDRPPMYTVAFSR
jgi:hypothetical protein